MKKTIPVLYTSTLEFQSSNCKHLKFIYCNEVICYDLGPFY